MEGAACAECGAVGSLEYEQESGTLACNRCGTVSAAQSSQAFEFLARVDDEDASGNGRLYVNEHALARAGGMGAAGIAALGGRASQYAAGTLGKRKEMYHERRSVEIKSFIGRLLRRFDCGSQFAPAFQYFANLKHKLGFSWGYRADVFAAACVYIAARAEGREVWISQILDACDSLGNPIHLSRAIRLTKLELSIKTKEVDPHLFIERILVHLQDVFRQPKPSFHAGAKLKPFGKKNLEWIRGVELDKVRSLTVDLLKFSNKIYLVHGRSPEQVACAVVVVALEGVARRPTPKQQEFDEELAHLTKTAAFTIQERYREFTAALLDYAPQLPWIGDRAKKWKKKDVVESTVDIVQYWTLLDAQQKRGVVDDAEGEAAAETRMRDTADDGEEEKVHGAKVETDEATGEGTRQAEGEAADDEDDELDDEAQDWPSEVHDRYFPDPLVALTAAAKYAFSADMDDADESGRVPSRKGSYAASVAKRPGAFVRGSKEWNRQHAAQRAVAQGLAVPTPSPSPAPEPRQPDVATLSTKPAAFASMSAPVPLDRASLEINQLLLSGQRSEDVRAQLAPEHIGCKSRKSKRDKDTRLNRLLWEKAAKDIDDDELFDDGELDSYVRTPEEAASVRQLPEYAAMVKAADEVATRPKHDAVNRPRRRVRGQLNEEYLELEAEAKRRDMTVNGVLRSRVRKERGESDDEGVGREFRPRKKKTKVTAEVKERLAALLARGVSDDEGENDARSNEWVGLAMDVARDAGVDERVDADGDKRHSEGEDEEDGQAWRREFGYAPVNGYGYDDD
ncbi:hypothetical protein JCM10212_003643 [Sporobolomyces blumeae]